LLQLLAHQARPKNQKWLEKQHIWGLKVQDYNKKKPIEFVERPTKSLKTKWGIIRI
jgi:hypothetical protein